MLATNSADRLHAGSYLCIMAIEILQGDITALHVDAIVNAANETLLGGGGRTAAFARVWGTRAPRRAPEAGCRRPGCLASDGPRA